MHPQLNPTPRTRRQRLLPYNLLRTHNPHPRPSSTLHITLYTLLLVHSIHRGYIHVEVPRVLRRVPQTGSQVRAVFDAGVWGVVGGEGEEERW